VSHNVTYLNPEGLAPAQGLYSQAGRVDGGRTHFIAGQLSVGGDGEIAGVGDFAAQFEQVFDNLGAVLDKLGMGFDDIVKFNTYLLDADMIDLFMAERAKRFPALFRTDVYPPNTLLVVNRLVDARFMIEVEAVAVSGS